MKRQIGKAAALTALGLGLQLAGSVPAFAARNLAALSPVAIPESGMTVYGSAPAIDNHALNDGLKLPGGESPPSNAAAVPEPAGWLMMVLGFGLLGAMTRRRMPRADAGQHVI